MSQQPVQSQALGELRVQIDALDRQLLQLLNDRAKVAEKVGEIKRAEGSPFFRPDRVAQVIDKITGANPGPLKDEHVASIWREIMSACRALEAPQRVAYLGPAGTTSRSNHVAASSARPPEPAAPGSQAPRHWPAPDQAAL